MKAAVKNDEKIRMQRVWDVFTDPDFIFCMKETAVLEKERIYCRHDMGHLLATARLAYIFSLERGYGIDRSLIYAAALLHDCGRAEEYKSGIPHDRAGAGTAYRILSRYDFSEKEIEEILAAIRGHRETGDVSMPEDRLSEVLYDADKMSRNCFLCGARDSCSWSDEKKNLTILW